MQVASVAAKPARCRLSRFLREARPRAQRAFTLFELMLVVVIVGIVTAVAVPSYEAYIDKAKIAQAKVDIVSIESVLVRYYAQHGGYPDTLAEAGVGHMLDPWRHPYRYLNIANAKGKGQLRKDHNLVPINSDYDLYSMGKDGASQPPLTAKASHDDIIRANNGAFVGLASDY